MGEVVYCGFLDEKDDGSSVLHHFKRALEEKTIVSSDSASLLAKKTMLKTVVKGTRS